MKSEIMKSETMQSETMQKKYLNDYAVIELSERLSLIDDLYLPQSVSSNRCHGGPVTQSDIKDYLFSLLRRDAAIFLERYGKLLKMEELVYFDGLKEDYEVNWHLSHLRTNCETSNDNFKSNEKKRNNRRLAYMHRLLREGSYFSEESIRERSPLIHYELMGRFQPLKYASAASLPGEKLSDTLIRQSQDMEYQNNVKKEFESMVRNEFPSFHKVDEMDIEEDEKEEEEEEEEEEEGSSENEGGGFKAYKPDQMHNKEKIMTNEKMNGFDNGASQASLLLEFSSEEENKGVNWGEMKEKKKEKKENESVEHAFKMSSIADDISSIARTMEEMKTKEETQREVNRGEWKDRSENSMGSCSINGVNENHHVNVNVKLSDEELNENMKSLNKIMQEKFLNGEDDQFVDYIAIDSNAELDDDWILEISRDAEDKYFDED